MIMPLVCLALLLLSLSAVFQTPAGKTNSAVQPGIEVFLAGLPEALRGKRVGLITNHTGIDRARTPDIDLIARHKELKLVALLAPEHGIRGTVEAGEKVTDETDPKTGVPIYSLYKSEDRGQIGRASCRERV